MDLAPFFTVLDAFNAQDPRSEQGVAKELLYARRMSEWLDRLCPNASDELRLAARAQHIGRWMIARTAYPEGPLGYKQWRAALTKLHAETAAELLAQAGLAAESVARVQALIRKERLKSDADSQLLEDVVCLVFLENYFAEFSAKHDPEKVVDILRKTWKKMGAQGQAEALKLPMGAEAQALVARALAPALTPE